MTTRRPQHTGEHVTVEPLARFLRRGTYYPLFVSAPAQAAWLPSLEDYDRRDGKREAA